MTKTTIQDNKLLLAAWRPIKNGGKTKAVTGQQRKQLARSRVHAP